jgi:hypothetical protein
MDRGGLGKGLITLGEGAILVTERVVRLWFSCEWEKDTF